LASVKRAKPRQKVAGHSAGSASTRLPWTHLLPVSVAGILCLPCLSLGYFWDDYYFLTGGERGDYRAYFLPDPHAAFYRPIPQGFHFLLLRLLDPVNGGFAHVLNLAILACAIALVTQLVAELSGWRAGLLSGLVLASYGFVPGLVAWVSCSQDLLAVALVLAAFLLRHRGRNVGALVAASAALFCKEPAIAAFPVLVLWDRLVGRAASRPRFQIIAYTTVALAWVFLHPGLRLLASKGFQSGATGYVGLEQPERWGRYGLRYLLSLVNIPPAGFVAEWLDDRVTVGLAALATMIVGFLMLGKRFPFPRTTPRARVALVGALFAVPTLLMPALLIRHWAPYFAFFPAVGVAMALGPLLARYRTPIVLAVLAAFLLLGIRYRGLRPGNEPVWAEQVFVDAGAAARVVRTNFKTIFPSLPGLSQVVVSVSSTGVRGIYSTLVEGQALRVWYRDPTLHTVPTLRRLPDAPAEVLVRVTSDLDVIAIDPDTRRVQATTRYQPDLSEIGRPIVNYARAVAAVGDTDRAVRITQSLALAETGPNAAYVTRLSAMFLIAAGRREEAETLLATVSNLSKEDALWSIRPVVTEPSASEELDRAVFEAFGLSSSDPEALRWIMREFVKIGSVAQAAWYAEQLLRIIPGDPEGAGVLDDARRKGIAPRRVV
jgi:hypothetical protein